MAYQPKNYKKFVATAATATLVATAIAPAAFADQASTSAFTDVGDRYEEAVEYVVSNNIAKGLTATQFGVGESITRGDAAIMIATATGIMDETAPNSGFSDVPKRGAVAVNSLKEAGILKGVSTTKFGWEQEITRGQAAYMLAVAYELEDGDASDLDFTDVGEDHRFAKEVAALVENKITKGETATKFGIESSIKRGDFAVFLHRLYELENQEAPDTEAPVLELDGSSKITVENGAKLVLPKVTVTDNVDEDIEIERTYFDAAGKEIESIDTSKAGTYQVFFSAEDAAGNVADDLIVTVIVKEAVAEAPAVKSVSAINATQVKVSFNTVVDADDAAKVERYTLEGTSPTTVKLSDDKKSVVLTFATEFDGKEGVLVVNPILTKEKDKNGEVVSTEKYSTVFSYDTIKPEITKVAYADGKITLTFSEDLGKAPSVVRVNDQPIAASDFEVVGGNKVVIYKSLNANDTATLYIAGATDNSEARNEMNVFNSSVTAPAADLEKPSITSVQVINEDTAKITLSEKVQEDVIKVKLQQGTVQENTELFIDTEDKTEKTYTLTVPGLFSDTKKTTETFTLYAEAGVMTDFATPKPNKNDFYSTLVTFVKDETAPTLSSASVTAKNEKLEFTFSEDLEVKGYSGQITIRNSQGVDFLAVDKESGLKEKDASTYLLDFKATAAALDAGTYTVSFPAGFFTDVYGNKSAVVSSTIVVPEEAVIVDDKKPTASITTSDTNEFTVAYSEEVAANGVDLSSYRLDGQPLPDGTDIYFTGTDKKTVVIALPVGSVNIGNQETGAPAVLTVLDTADKAGNKIETTSSTVTIKDNTAAIITDVKNAGDVVVVTFNEVISIPNVDANEVFDIKVGGTTVNAGNLVVVDGNESQVRFTLDKAPTETLSTTVKVGQDELVDRNGVLVK